MLQSETAATGDERPQSAKKGQTGQKRKNGSNALLGDVLDDPGDEPDVLGELDPDLHRAAHDELGVDAGECDEVLLAALHAARGLGPGLPGLADGGELDAGQHVPVHRALVPLRRQQRVVGVHERHPASQWPGHCIG